jgi:enoyl-[acyl-carrier protein] reductase I
MTNQLLKGKRGIIFGALNEQSIAWQTAERAYEEGASFVLTNTPAALRIGETNLLSEKCNAPLVTADATNVEDLENLVQKSVEYLGGKLDFILHSVAMSFNVRKGKPYENLDYDLFQKTLDVSALSFHKVIQIANRLDALNEYASILALSFLASHRTCHGYNDMADAKAMLESIARSFGYILGKEKKIRINTISQSPIPTKATNGINDMEAVIDFSARISPLGNASAYDCARLCVVMFSDYTRMVTMQNIYNDGGFSSMALNSDIAKMIECEKRSARS